MSWYLEQNLEKKYVKEYWRRKIYNFTGKKIFTKSLSHKETYDNFKDNI